jgi:hypothetical protein
MNMALFTHTTKAALMLPLSLAMVAGVANAGIPVYGPVRSAQDDVERMATAYAELVRQREADVYNRKKAEDLKRARVAVHPATPEAAAARPEAQRPIGR